MNILPKRKSNEDQSQGLVTMVDHHQQFTVLGHDEPIADQSMIDNRSTGPELPPYINHVEGVNRIGKLTAAAIVRDYEETAVGFNAMGDEIKRVAECCERYLGELQELIQHADQVAKQARERGSEIFRWLEQSSLTTEQVRKDTDTMAAKLADTVIAAS